ncbi:porin [Paraburkholderia ferrariae]|uniref:porin n=1 Tax=Paraburkholderia ferrariae TaxID=386056 RepID=UPI0009FF876A|nr:porin [Paraburkholderia ferrariae]
MRRYVKGSALGAAALLSCAAHAQSSVTLYGVVDEFVENMSGGGQHLTALSDAGMHGNRIGLIGSEDIGGGTKVIFNLEAGFLASNGQSDSPTPGAFFDRRAYVGMSNQTYGTVKMGLIETAGYNWASQYDVMMIAPASVLGSLVADQPRPFVGNNERDPGRLPNTLSYETPNIHGFNAQYTYSFGSADTDNSPSYNVLGLYYAQGPLTTGVLLARVGPGDGLTPATSAQNEADIGVSYNIKYATLYGTFMYRNVMGFDADKGWTLGAAIPINTESQIRIGGGKMNSGQKNGSWDLTAVAIDYMYFLSKSTSLYAFAKQLWNSGNAHQTAFLPGGLPSPLESDSSQRIVGVGISHKF